MARCSRIMASPKGFLCIPQRFVFIAVCLVSLNVSSADLMDLEVGYEALPSSCAAVGTLSMLQPSATSSAARHAPASVQSAPLAMPSPTVFPGITRAATPGVGSSQPPANVMVGTNAVTTFVSSPILCGVSALIITIIVCCGCTIMSKQWQPSDERLLVEPPAEAAASATTIAAGSASAAGARNESGVAAWALLCDDLVVPSFKECSLRVPFLNEQEIANIIFYESGLLLFQAAVVQDEQAGTKKLVLATPAEQPEEQGLGATVLFFSPSGSGAGEEGGQQRPALELMSASGEAFGCLSVLHEDGPQGNLKLTTAQGGKVIWRFAPSSSTVHVVDEAENFLAVVETRLPARSRIITVGPRMDVALVVGCTLAGDWLCRLTSSTAAGPQQALPMTA